MAVLYRHIRLDTNVPFYIGIGKTEKRAHNKVKRNIYWSDVVKESDYKVDILFGDLTWEEACEKEIEFIKLYGRKDLGTGTLVNLTDGGQGFVNLSEKTLTIIREKLTGENNPFYGKKHSEKTIELLKSFTGEKSSMFGKKLSQDTKNKMSISSQEKPKPRLIKTKSKNCWRVSFYRFKKRIELGVFPTEEESYIAIENYEKYGLFPKKEYNPKPYFNKTRNKTPWQSRVCKNGQRIELGSFKTEQEAWNAIEEWKKNSKNQYSSKLI